MIRKPTLLQTTRKDGSPRNGREAYGNSKVQISKRSIPRMATQLTPLHDRIVVRRVEEAETTRGGIIIPDSAKDKPQEGEVIAAGRGKTNDEGKTFPLD